MKTIAQSGLVQNTSSIPEQSKLNNNFSKPLKAGFSGFTTILMIIFSMKLIHFIMGYNEKFGMDILDLLLAGIGFVLQMTHTSLKNIR